MSTIDPWGCSGPQPSIRIHQDPSGSQTLARPTAKRSSSRTALIKLSRYLEFDWDLLGDGFKVQGPTENHGKPYGFAIKYIKIWEFYLVPAHFSRSQFLEETYMIMGVQHDLRRQKLNFRHTIMIRNQPANLLVVRVLRRFTTQQFTSRTHTHII